MSSNQPGVGIGPARSARQTALVALLEACYPPTILAVINSDIYPRRTRTICCGMKPCGGSDHGVETGGCRPAS